jgi:hypothetical protein
VKEVKKTIEYIKKRIGRDSIYSIKMVAEKVCRRPGYYPFMIDKGYRIIAPDDKMRRE